MRRKISRCLRPASPYATMRMMTSAPSMALAWVWIAVWNSEKSADFFAAERSAGHGPIERSGGGEDRRWRRSGESHPRL